MVVNLLLTRDSWGDGGSGGDVDNGAGGEGGTAVRKGAARRERKFVSLGRPGFELRAKDIVGWGFAVPVAARLHVRFKLQSEEKTFARDLFARGGGLGLF